MNSPLSLSWSWAPTCPGDAGPWRAHTAAILFALLDWADVQFLKRFSPKMTQASFPPFICADLWIHLNKILVDLGSNLLKIGKFCKNSQISVELWKCKSWRSSNWRITKSQLTLSYQVSVKKKLFLLPCPGPHCSVSRSRLSFPWGRRSLCPLWGARSKSRSSPTSPSTEGQTQTSSHSTLKIYFLSLGLKSRDWEM